MTLRRTLAVLAVVASAAAGAPAARAADPAHDPVVDCSGYWRYAGVLVYAGVAYAPPGHPAPTSLTIFCSYTDEWGRYSSTNTTRSSYVVTAVGGGLLWNGTMTVCESAVAEYADGHVGTVPQRCYTPA